MTNLYFVRHAHSVYTPDELNRPLSEQGLVDAKKVTDLLKHEPIDKIISSPYKRAIQTVENYANYVDLTIFIKDDLKERKLSKQPVDDFHKAMNEVWSDYTFQYQGGESNHMAQRRGIHVINSILLKEMNKNIVISTHGNLMVLIMNYFDKKYDYNFWKQLNMPDIYKLSFNNNELKKVTRLWKD